MATASADDVVGDEPVAAAGAAPNSAEASGVPPGDAAVAAAAAAEPSPAAPVASEQEGPAVAARAPTTALSASAAEFVPHVAMNDGDGAQGSTAKREGDDESDVLAHLPESHLQCLRRFFQAPNGECVAYYVGRLKSYNQRTGYGFLECAQSWAIYGADVFIHKNNVPNPWHIGQPVEFAVYCNTRGQPQAADVNWLPRLPVAPRAPAAAGAAGAARSGAGASGAPRLAASSEGRPLATSAVGAGAAAAQGAAAMGADAAAGGAPMPPVTAPVNPPLAGAVAPGAEVPELSQGVATEPRHLGTLKSYSPAQGYGFIACDEVFQQYQRDTYFSKTQLSSGSWTYGQTVEFAAVPNAKGQPQARQIDWDPVPLRAADSLADPTAPAPAGGKKGLSPTTLQTLRKLLRLLSENKETAVITAIDLQGGSQAGAGQEADGDREVDFVSFVLDRLGPEADATAAIKDFVKMLLLLMLSKMLRVQHREQRCAQLVRWFEVLAQAIQPGGDRVPEHFQDVVKQINTHLQHASRENPRLGEEGVHKRTLGTAFNQLESKAAGLRAPAA